MLGFFYRLRTILLDYHVLTVTNKIVWLERGTTEVCAVGGTSSLFSSHLATNIKVAGVPDNISSRSQGQELSR